LLPCACRGSTDALTVMAFVRGSREWARPPSLRDWPLVSSMATCLTASRARRSSGWTWVRPFLLPLTDCGSLRAR
jgi:hypothetical protein